MPAKKIDLRSQIQPNQVAAESAATRTPAPTPPVIDDDELVRKEIRVRPDQVDALVRLRRRINAERKRAGDKSPAMTDRVLCRVALDYLLEHQEHLHGFTEADLLSSLRATSTD